MKRSTLAWCGLLAAVGTLAVPLVPEVLAQMAPPTESKGIAAKVIGSLPLAPEISGIENRQLRMRVVTMAPGGVFAVHSLKVAYLRCERAAAESLLGVGDAANCSVIYEELLKVGFGGDFKRLLAWWHAERVAEARGERIATH